MNEDNEEESEESDEDYSSQIPSTTAQQWIDGHAELVNKSPCPAITYWLALTTPNGAPASRIVVHRTLLKCGVSVTASKVSIQTFIHSFVRSFVQSFINPFDSPSFIHLSSQ